MPFAAVDVVLVGFVMVRSQTASTGSALTDYCSSEKAEVVKKSEEGGAQQLEVLYDGLSHHLESLSWLGWMFLNYF